MVAKIGWGRGVCPRCGKTIHRKRPANLAVCNCYKYCPIDHGKGAYGTLMEKVLPRVTMEPIEDATVSSSAPDFNMGSSSVLEVETGDDNRRAFLKFNIQNHMDYKDAQAILYLYNYLAQNQIQNVTDVEAREVEDTTWLESTITWNNQPTYGSVITSLFIPTGEIGWHAFDISSYIQKRINEGKRLFL